VAGVKDLRQAQIFGQLQEGLAGTVFARRKNTESVGGAFSNDVAAEGGLDELEFVQRQAGNTAVIGMDDFTVGAERRADNAVVLGAMSLDLQVEIGGDRHG
jgi:hypothetical protein